MYFAKKKTDADSVFVYELIYFIYFFIMFGVRAFGFHEGLWFYNPCLSVGFLVFALKIATTRHTLFEYIWIYALMLMGLIVYLNTGEKGILLYFSMMLGMKYISTRKVFRLGLVMLGTAYPILFILSFAGVIDEMNHIIKRSGFGFILRHSLGYPYPNTAHTTLLILIMLFFYLYKFENTKKLLKISAVAMVLNLLIFIYTVSFTGLISITAYLVLNIYFSLRKNRNRAENGILAILFPATVIFSIVGPLLAKGEVFEFMNKLLHKRYEYALYFLQNEDITLMGSRFGATPTDWYMIDNSFLYLFLQLGIIPFTVICILYFFWILNLIKAGKNKELAIMVTFCLIGMSDPFLFNIAYKNLTFVFIGEWIYEVSERKLLSLPAVLRKEICLIPAGEKKVDISFWHKLIEVYKSIFFSVKKNFLITNIIFILVTFIGGSIYLASTQKPEILYADEHTSDPYNTEKREAFLTESEVLELTASGNIVEDYEDENSPMYYFKEPAPSSEYYRRALSFGLSVAIIVTLCITAPAFNIFSRKKCKV